MHTTHQCSIRKPHHGHLCVVRNFTGYAVQKVRTNIIVRLLKYQKTHLENDMRLIENMLDKLNRDGR